MLVLTRKIGQTIHIGDDIVIHIVQLEGNRTRVGIQAPRDIQIRRGEIEPKEPQQQLDVVEPGPTPVPRPAPKQIVIPPVPTFVPFVATTFATG